jgi:hypothetical protein
LAIQQTMPRDRVCHAVAQLTLLAAAALSVVAQGAAAASPVFSATGKSFVLSTPKWTLLSPLPDAKGVDTGVFINGTFIYTFSAPKNKASVALPVLLFVQRMSKMLLSTMPPCPLSITLALAHR